MFEPPVVNSLLDVNLRQKVETLPLEEAISLMVDNFKEVNETIQDIVNDVTEFQMKNSDGLFIPWKLDLVGRQLTQLASDLADLMYFDRITVNRVAALIQ